MDGKRLNQLLNTGDSLSAEDIATYRFPTVPSTIDRLGSETTDYCVATYVPGATKKVTLTLANLVITVADATQGVGIKLLDFLSGTYRINYARASLTFKTTSVLADTLNLSKTINWALGTATQSTTTLKGTAESDILPVTTATSSATINVANAATHGERYLSRILDSTTAAPDLYLNVSVPTSGDIDGDATVAVSGTIELAYQDVGLNSAITNTSRMPSAALWANCPEAELTQGTADGFVVWQDFLGTFAQATNIAATASKMDGGWVAFTGNDAGNTITLNTDEPYGSVVSLLTGDNLSTTMAWGGSQLAGQVVFEAGKRVWFEARVKVSSITDDRGGFFIGFGEEGLCVTVGVIGATDALTDKDLIGFHRDAADGDQMDLKYNTASGGGVTSLKADALASALAADTYTKLGIYCDGTTIYFYQDGTAISSGSVALSATNVPDGEEMCIYLAGTNKGGTGNSLEIDWVKVAQQRE